MSGELPIREPAKQSERNGNAAVSFGHGIREDFLFDKDYLNLNHGMTVLLFNCKNTIY
jgi:hypothetical protein